MPTRPPNADEALPKIERRTIEPALEPALRALAAHGLPEQPKRLTLDDVTWAGTRAPDISEIAVEDDGTLRLEARPTSAAVVVDPADWDPDSFVAEARDHGRLLISQGWCEIHRWTLGTDGPNFLAHLEGWAWSAGTSAGARLWCAPLRFITRRPPMVLRVPTGNMLLAVAGSIARGWYFSLCDQRVFLLRGGDDWYIALEVRTEGLPDARLIHLFRSVLGFAIGEPFGLGLFRPISDDGVMPCVAHLELLNPSRRGREENPPSALPIESASIARFVELVVALAQDTDAPVLEAIHLYFASLSGFIESNFLHAWLAAEVVARWGIESRRFTDAGATRLADAGAWRAWVAAHATEIEALAAAGKGQSLLDRVRGAEIESPTRVQRALRGLGVEWTPEMADVERSRHGVTHEGAFPGRDRDWDRNRARVGLVETMLTAMLSKLAGYQGPIADRSKTCYDIAARDEPPWWPHPPEVRVQYRGDGVEEILAAAKARLERTPNDS